jgi:hypothetical protein
VKWEYAEYSTFKVGPESDRYRLNVAGYVGNAGDAMTNANFVNHVANGRTFSTVDNDVTTARCASQGGGGWWYNLCSCSALNNNANAIWTTAPAKFDVVSSRMMILCT